MRRIHFTISTLSLLWLVPACSDSPTTPRDPFANLTERLETEHFIFHFEPGDYVEAERSEAFARWAKKMCGCRRLTALGCNPTGSSGKATTQAHTHTHPHTRHTLRPCVGAQLIRRTDPIHLSEEVHIVECKRRPAPTYAAVSHSPSAITPPRNFAFSPALSNTPVHECARRTLQVNLIITARSHLSNCSDVGDHTHCGHHLCV